MAKIYAYSDIFLYYFIIEIFGFIILESMANKIPIIARDKGEFSKIVTNSKSRYLILPADFDSFVKHILKLDNKSATPLVGHLL